VAARSEELATTMIAIRPRQRAGNFTKTSEELLCVSDVLKEITSAAGTC
jgi:hypothetical protein